MTLMTSRIVTRFLIYAVLLVTRASQAQALPTAIGPGTYIALGGGISTFPSDYDTRKLTGTTLFLDIQPTFRYGFEAEARFLRYNTDEGVDQTNYLAGLHIGLRPQRLRPYAKFLAGATRLQTPFGYGRGTFLTFVPGAGVDLRLTDRWTARLIDIEYQIVPQFIANSSSRNLGVGIGLSYRLNSLPRFPR